MLLIIYPCQGGAERGAGGSKFPRAPTLIGPQLESESLKFSTYLKLVRPFLKLRAPWALALIVAPHAGTLAKV